MAHTKSTLGWLLALGIGLVTVAAPLASAQNQGLVVRDDTIGSGPLEVGPGSDPLGRPASYLITPEMGEQQGANLFHSFARFGIGVGEIATFTGPDPIDGPQSVSNVISRVTGGSESRIEGTLRSTIPGADLWLLNPSGVVFGQGAQLDVPGSFHASTGDYVAFGDGDLVRFYSDPLRPSVLSTARPESFGFLGEQAAQPISLTGATLETKRRGDTVSLVAGDVLLDGATIRAENGRVNLAAVASAGEVVLGPADADEPVEMRGFGALGEVRLQARNGVGALVDVSGDAPGQVFIRGGGLVVRGGDVAGAQRSEVFAENAGNAPADPAQPGPGLISVETSESVHVDNGLLSVSTSSSGSGGTIHVTSPDVIFERAPPIVQDEPQTSAIGARAETTGMGAAGRIQIDAAHELIVRDGAAVSAAAVGTRQGILTGPAGTVQINGHSVQAINRARISAATWGSSADAGSIEILLGEDGNLLLDGAGDFARITTLALLSPHGDAGEIKIQTGSLVIRNKGFIYLSTDGDGAGGRLTVDAKSLTIESAAIDARTYRSGNAGTITIDADSVVIDSGGSINAQTDGAGAGGTITIGSGLRPVETLTIESGGSINAHTTGSGHAGTIDVNADSVLLRGDGSGAVSKISAGAIGPAATGNGGTIDITANTFAIEQGGVINAGSSQNARGNGGDIHVAAKESIDITNQGGPRFSLRRDILPQIPPDPSHPPVFPTGIFSATVLGGDGGEITLDAPQIRIAEGAIVATSTVAGGNAGNILLGTRNPGDRILIEKGGVVDSTSFLTKGAAGSVTLQANESIEVIGRHPEFTDDLSRVASASLGEGAPGAVTLRAPRILVDEGAVATAAVPLQSGGAGTAGGDITLEGAREVVVRRGGQVNASSFGQGAAGSITVEATGSILVEGAGSGIVSRTGASGDGGDVVLHAPRIKVASGGEVSARSAPGLDEVEAIFATLRDDGLLRTPPEEATGDAGSITLEASRLVHLDAGEITTSVGVASGGDITIDPELVLLQNGSRIVATAGTGHGGAIQITADNYFAFPGSVVSAASGNSELSGTVEIHAPDVNLAGQATPLPASFLDASSLMRERCAARRSGERAGSFAVRGSGGIPPEPDGWLPAPFDVASGPFATTLPPTEPGDAPLLALGSCP